MPATSVRAQALAILWAQWRVVVNYSPWARGRTPVTWIISLAWYGLWVFAAFGVYLLCSDPSDHALLRRILPAALLLVMLYWQLVPILLASAGLSLELKRLIVYPVPHSALFRLEVMLRLTNAAEMLILIAGAAIGLLVNPRTPGFGVLFFIPFLLLNLFLSTGLRELLGRLMARKRVREIVVVVIVLLAAAPQALMYWSPPDWLRAGVSRANDFYWPWVTTARLLLGSDWLASSLALAGWLGLAWAFGRSQFEKTLRTDVQETKPRVSERGQGVTEALLRLPSRLLRDPLGALVEKEVRLLSRAPRFRLVFIMGSLFSLLIWVPFAFRAEDADSWMARHFLTVVSAYSLMLLGEVCVWNAFGFDRAAVQVYFAMPVRLSAVLLAKNVTAVIFVTLEILIIATICVILRMPLRAPLIVEAFSVTMVMTIFLLGIGNMLTTYHPRPVNPDESWRRSSAGRVQAMLLAIYPLVAAPVALAFLARHAFDSEYAFYFVLAVDFAIGAVVYAIAMESALSHAGSSREDIIAALSRHEGLVG